MKSKHVKRLLSSAIAEVASTPEDYCVNPNCDFTRSGITSVMTGQCSAVRKRSVQRLTSSITMVSAQIRMTDGRLGGY